MWFVIIVLIAAFIFISVKTSPSASSNSTSKISFPENHSDIDSVDTLTMIEAVDHILNTEFPLYYIKEKIRERIYSALKAAQTYDKANFHDFCTNADKRYWSLAQISSHAFDLIATGNYNIQGTPSLTLEGTHLKEIYIWCLDRAYALNYIDKDTRNQQIQTLFEQIKISSNLS